MLPRWLARRSGQGSMPQDPSRTRTGPEAMRRTLRPRSGRRAELVAVTAPAAAVASATVTARAARSACGGAGRASGVADGDHVPRELLAAEGVLEAVPGDLAGLVLGEAVQGLAVVGDLHAPVGPLDGPQLARDRAGARRL